MNDMGIDISALNETKLDSSYDHDFTEIAGYSQKRLDRSCFGGGVSIYVRETIRFLIRNDIPSENLEMLCVEVQPPKCQPFLLFAGTDPQTHRLVFLPRQREFFHILTRKPKS